MNRKKIMKYSLSSMLAVVAALLIGACTNGPAPEKVADLIYTGGEIITLNDTQPTAEAIAIKDGKILMVGNMADIEKHKGNSTQIVNLNGQALLPGRARRAGGSVSPGAARGADAQGAAEAHRHPHGGQER